MDTLRRWAALLLLWAAPAAAWAQNYPFYATSEGGQNLVSINQTSGVATTIGSLGYQSSYTGAFTPDGRYWTIINSAFAGQLAEVNLTTGQATPRPAPPVFDDWIISLEANREGKLFAGGHSGRFYSVDPVSGQFTLVSTLGIYTCDFAFDNDGRLWAVDGSFNLWELNPATGQVISNKQIVGMNDGTMSIQVDPSNNFYVATQSFPARLYRLNPATGVATQIGSNLGVNYIHGGDFQPNALFYATSEDGRNLVSINQTTGVARTIGSFGFSSTYTGAFTPDGRFWTIVNSSFAGQLAQVNLQTGQATPVGAPPVTNDWIISLDANPAGQLFAGSHTGRYYSVNPATGQFTLIAQVGIYTCDFAFDTSGRLWAVDGGFTLYELNPATGAFISAKQITGLNAGTMSIQVDSSNNFYVATTSFPAQLYRLNPTTGAATLVGTNLGVNYIHGGDFLPALAVATPQAPVATNDVYNTDEDIALAVPAPGVLGNDNDADTPRSSLIAILVSGPAHGSVALSPNGAFVYTPAPNYNGPDSFTYRVSDGALNSNVATVNLTVIPVNDLTIASNDAYSMDEDGSLAVSAAQGVLANDIDADVGETRSVVLVDAPTHAAAFALNPDGSFTYVPLPNFNGADTFTYRVNDAGLPSNVAMVVITVRPVNDAPVAAGDSYSTSEDVPLTVAAPGVLGNDSDVDGDALTAVLVSGPAHGAVALNANGSFTYTPAANYNGPDSFTYRAMDSAGGGSDVVTVSIELAAVNDAPSIVALSVSPPIIGEGGSVGLDGSFTDPDSGDSHVVTIDWGDGSTPTTLDLAPGVFAFSAGHTYVDDRSTGADTYAISVTVKDAAGASGNASASVAVDNLAPVITSVTGPTTPVAAGQTVTIAAAFTDAGGADTHTCTFKWNDGTPDTVVTVAGTGNGACTANHVYAGSNVYEVRVTVTDDDGAGATESFRYVVSYDSAAGFVTGGGWINSPAGAYAANPALAGKATFGFVSKYKSGSSVPTGNTEFQFKAADLNFKSTAYEWMVISGAKVRYRGTGTINGAGSFGFELTAWDGDMPGGGGADRLRLKIWDQNRGNAMVYDNQTGADDGADPTTALGGGSIVIHK